MSTMKVYGWTHMRAGQQTREVIAAPSWARASELSGIAVGSLRKYGAISENSEEHRVAKRFPDEVIWRPLDVSRTATGGWFRNDGTPIDEDTRPRRGEITQIRVVCVEGNGRVTSKAYNQDEDSVPADFVGAFMEQSLPRDLVLPITIHYSEEEL